VSGAFLRASLRRHRGVSLVELLVSILIGTVVVGALLVTYLSSTLAARRQHALSQMADDAQLALALMRREIQLAGSQEPAGLQPQGAGFTPSGASRMVFGCEAGFEANDAVAGGATCVTGSTSTSTAKNASLELTHVATARTAAQNKNGKLVNCVGSEVNAGDGVSSRWFVALGRGKRNELYCAAPGSARQPLVENVEALHLRYGLAAGWKAEDPQTRRPQRYLLGSELSATDWASVVAVRICVLMKSAQPVLTTEDPRDYIDCAGASHTSPDRHLYRSFATTVGIRNRGPY
jgi:type IV pilus assembly protein PilW